MQQELETVTQATGSIADRLKNIRVLLVGPSLEIMGGQSVQLDLLHRHFKNEGATVDFLPVNPVPWWPLKYLRAIKYVRTAVVSLFYIASLFLRVWRYDVVHVFSASYLSFIIAPTPAILIGKLFGRKVILNYRSGEARDHFRRWGKSIFWIIRLADKIVVPSQYLVDVFREFNFKAEFIYNIAEAGAFKFQPGSTCRTIIVPRNLEPLYDIETAIRAFSRMREKMPDLQLVVVGSGSDETRLKQIVVQEGIEQVTFTGRVERSEMPELFAAADIFLNTSVIDNMPVAIVEAFHSGLPVVTTDAGGIPYIVENEVTGLVVPMRDVQAVTVALERVITDAELRTRLVDNARESARQFTWESVRFQWADLYAGLVEGDE